MSIKSTGKTDLIVDFLNSKTQLTRIQSIADRVDRVGFLTEKTLISVSTIALATAIPAADKLYVDSAGKVFGPIV